MSLEWSQILITFLTTALSAGGIGWIVTIREDKKSKKLENKQKENEIKDHEKDEVIKDWKEIAEERRRRCEDLKHEVDIKDTKLAEKDEIISDLKAKLDEKNTYCAVAELLRCETVSCSSRKPPFGMRETKIESSFVNSNNIKNIE